MAHAESGDSSWGMREPEPIGFLFGLDPAHDCLQSSRSIKPTQLIATVASTSTHCCSSSDCRQPIG